MNGLYVYSIMVGGPLLALFLWISRRYNVPLYGQAKIAFLFGAFMLWAIMMTGLYSPFQSSVHLTQQNRNPALAATPSDNRVILEKFFDTPQHSGQQPPQPTLAYAAPESDVLNNERKITSGPLLGLDSWTAVYDISAHTVYLPDGTELEAHSGRGGGLDDPRYVHEHMRGATPPNVYELALREKTFHGVQALRLKPVGGGNIFGRSGLLAHTYMLGPKGESNGCVVFKNYNAFLQAFQNGQVKRLFVVDNLNRTSKVTLTVDQDLTPQPSIRVASRDETASFGMNETHAERSEIGQTQRKSNNWPTRRERISSQHNFIEKLRSAKLTRNRPAHFFKLASRMDNIRHLARVRSRSSLVAHRMRSSRIAETMRTERAARKSPSTTTETALCRRPKMPHPSDRLRSTDRCIWPHPARSSATLYPSRAATMTTSTSYTPRIALPAGAPTLASTSPGNAPSKTCTAPCSFAGFDPQALQVPAESAWIVGRRVPPGPRSKNYPRRRRRRLRAKQRR
jgi:Protein of unknown function (DUF2778)